MNIDIKDQSLKFLKPVLQKWISVHKIYTEKSKNLNYLHNERANLSALAGAIWRCGGVALEEYAARKGEKNSSGRIDLYFGYEGKHIICEAKQKWIYLPKSQTKTDYWQRDIKPSLEEAKQDAQDTKKANSVDITLGITFIVPHWDKNFSNEEPPNSMNILKEQLVGMDCSFYAYSENIDNVHISSNTDDAYNSVILVGKIV